MTLLGRTFVCGLPWEYLLLWYSLAVILIAILPDSIFVCLFNAVYLIALFWILVLPGNSSDFPVVVLMMILRGSPLNCGIPGNTFDCGTPW